MYYSHIILCKPAGVLLNVAGDLAFPTQDYAPLRENDPRARHRFLPDPPAGPKSSNGIQNVSFLFTLSSGNRRERVKRSKVKVCTENTNSIQ